jgi:UDP-N-acetylmuramoylalanine--D-glutamate ligase
VVQSEALAELRAAGMEPPSKVITFSANNRRADLWYDRGLLQSRLDGWTGPLLDMAKCRVRGPHQAENLMAALAVGHVMRIPLETMVAALKDFEAGKDSGEAIGQQRGVAYVSDARASNPDALRQALQAVTPGVGGEPNIWLIAGGKDDGFEYHDLGPLLSRRVKRAFLLGEAAPRMRAAWSLFTPCTVVSSLLEAVQNAADVAECGDVVLFSPACSSCSEPSSELFGGQSFREAVRQLEGSTGGNPEIDRPSFRT